ncbi:hypothetical protein [Streptomyces sp. SCSIO ZS0520]|uniref:hypothetical protein n=1 Tax=Streptomyces sp. SCSIO ZS0520 TaxID=2892996 RepID=UPI0021D9E8C8|nr:hypothetical protein [Streptomyces sp. SCSIO ZS0520]
MTATEAYNAHLEHILGCARCLTAPAAELCPTGRRLKSAWAEARRTSLIPHRTKRTAA